MERTRVATTLLCLLAVAVPTQAGDLSVKKTIGPKGGVIEIPGYVKALIPPGALEREVELRIRAIPPPANIRLHSSDKIIGPAYEFTPDITFAKPAKIRLYCREEDCPPRSLTNGGWAVIIGVVANDWGVDMESSETGDPFPESAHQYPEPNERYVSLLATRWRGKWGGQYRVLFSTGLSIRERIGPEGGVVEFRYIEAVIPPGALAEEVELRIEQIRVPENVHPEVRKKIVGPVYAFAPAITFIKPVEIRLYYGDWLHHYARPGEDIRTLAARLGIAKLTPTGTLLPEASESGDYLRGTRKKFYGHTRGKFYVGLLTRDWPVVRTFTLP